MREHKKYINNLRRARFEVRKTQPELSLRTGISITKISLIENGLKRATSEDQQKLAKALNCDVTWLFPEEKGE